MLSSGKKTGRRDEYSLCKSLFSEVDINSLQWSVKSERYQESKFMSCIRLYFEIELFKKKKMFLNLLKMVRERIPDEHYIIARS